MSSASPAWRDAAYAELKAFVARYPNRDFLAYDVREFAKNRGLPAAATDAAWGSVMVRAKRAGLIQRVGFGIRPPSGNSNSTSVALWSAA